MLLAHALRQWPLRRVLEQHNAEHRVAQLFSNRVQPLGGASLVLDLAGAEVSFVRFSAAIRRTSQLARELTAGSLSLSDPDTGGRQNLTPRHQQRHKHKHSQRHSVPSRASKGISHGTPFAVSSIILPISRPDGFPLELSQASLESPTMWKRMAIVYFIHSWWPPRLGYATRGGMHPLYVLSTGSCVFVATVLGNSLLLCSH